MADTLTADKKRGSEEVAMSEKDAEIDYNATDKEFASEYGEIDPVADKRLVRKIDWKNIGQASVVGLARDLNLVGNQYNECLLIFFVGYVITEIPSNIALKYLKPSRWIPLIMFLWSITMICMGLVTNFGGLLAVRFILGLCESGLFPGVCYLLTSWYKRKETNFRVSLFFSAATLAGAFGGLIAYGISFMAGLGGKGGWAWIFIIEGLLTLVVACIAPFMVQDFPEQSTFLTHEEKAQVIRRLKEDAGAVGEAPFAWSHITSAFKDWRVYVYCLLYISVATPLYSLSLFIPTIIAGLGTYTRAQSQLLSTPPFFLAFAVTLTSAIYSDRVGNRGYFSMAWMAVALIGFVILLAVSPTPYCSQFPLLAPCGSLRS